MAIYTKRLVSERLPAYFDDQLYVAPSDRTVVVRDIQVVNHSVNVGAVNVYVQAPGGGSTRHLYWDASIASNSYQHWDGRQVLLPGESINAALGGAELSLWITGYELT